MNHEEAEKVKTWAACAERDGDPEAAKEILALLARTEKAERERDEAVRDARDMRASLSSVLVALGGPDDDNPAGLASARMVELRRAEADNAALLRLLFALGVRHGCSDATCGLCFERAQVEQQQTHHPGAPLLAELEALRRVRENVRPIEGRVRALADFDAYTETEALLCIAGDDERPGVAQAQQVAALLDACAAVDALKVTP